MVKTLRRKFVLIATGAYFAVMLFIIIAINLVNIYQLDAKANSMLYILAENDGKFPKPLRKLGLWDWQETKITPETPYETRYFIAKAIKGDEELHLDIGNIASLTLEEAEQLCRQILVEGKTSGYVNIYKYLITQDESEAMLTFVDCRRDLIGVMSVFIITSIVGLLSLLVVFGLVYACSGIAISPIVESIQKQKQFITDAGHELKTPLTIISANNDVLELVHGENEWTNSIKSQTERLAHLIGDMLWLSRMEENEKKMAFAYFSISEAISDVMQQFKIVAEKSGKELIADISENIKYYGDEGAIRQLIGILIDNSIKYASEEAPINISLKKSGKQVIITVQNATEAAPKNLISLFDRFYRADQSRARETGGFGIGLSIAKAIVIAHKGRIIASCTGGKSISFVVTLQ